jgi:hypothetical protein
MTLRPKHLRSTAAGSTSVTLQERRTHPRHTISATFEAIHLKANTRLVARISDLGRGGCYVDTINPFPVGADLQLKIAHGNESFVADAVVTYSAHGMGMGLHFTHMDAQRVELLERWIANAIDVTPHPAHPFEATVSRSTDVGPDEDICEVLSELILTLIRKGMLAEDQGRAMLKRLK